MDRDNRRYKSRGDSRKEEEETEEGRGRRATRSGFEGVSR